MSTHTAGGFDYGPSFRLLSKAWVGGGWACGLVQDGPEIAAVLDACMHPCGLLAAAASRGYPAAMAAVALRCGQSHNPTHPATRHGASAPDVDTSAMWRVIIRRHPDDAGFSESEATFDILATHRSKPSMLVEGLQLVGTDGQYVLPSAPRLYCAEWADFKPASPAKNHAVRDIRCARELDGTATGTEPAAAGNGNAWLRHDVRLVLDGSASSLASLEGVPPALRRIVCLAASERADGGPLGLPGDIDLVTDVARPKQSHGGPHDLSDSAAAQWEYLRWRELTPEAPPPTPRSQAAVRSARPSGAFRVTVDPNSLEPTFHECAAATALGDEEVEVEVKAYGMNFLDVLAATQVLPPENFGGECVGVVARCGGAVSNVRVGERVAAVLLGGFASVVRTNAAFVCALPDGISFEDAATIPVVYTTGWLALHWMARVRPHESVLLHNAAGGVGLACINILKAAGVARVLATCAPQERKHAVLSSAGVDAANIFNSRDASTWAAQRRADVIVGALFGESLARSFDAALPFGRVVDIGKREQTGGGSLRLAPFLRGLSYSAAHLDELMKSAPAEMRRLHEEVWANLGNGLYGYGLHSHGLHS